MDFVCTVELCQKTNFRKFSIGKDIREATTVGESAYTAVDL